jgi:hypothetical protein
MNPNIQKYLASFRLNRVRVRVSGDREPHRNRRNAISSAIRYNERWVQPRRHYRWLLWIKFRCDVMPFISQVLGGLVAVQLFKRVKN